jgi:hypothetical protein
MSRHHDSHQPDGVEASVAQEPLAGTVPVVVAARVMAPPSAAAVAALPAPQRARWVLALQRMGGNRATTAFVVGDTDGVRPADGAGAGGTVTQKLRPGRGVVAAGSDAMTESPVGQGTRRTSGRASDRAVLASAASAVTGSSAPGAAAARLFTLEDGGSEAASGRMLDRSSLGGALIARSTDGGGADVGPAVGGAVGGAAVGGTVGGAVGGAVGVSADAGTGGGIEDVVTIADYKVPTDPAVLRRQMEQLVISRGRFGPREYLDRVDVAVGATPVATADAPRRVSGANTVVARLRKVVEGLESEIDLQILLFTWVGHAVLYDVLKDSETRAKAEGIKYGLTEKTITEMVLINPEMGTTDYQTSTKYNMPQSHAGTGMAGAAAQLLKRRNERIAPLKSKQFELHMRYPRFAPDGRGPRPPKPPGLDETEAKLNEEEQEYDGLAAELAGCYPILGSFTKDKDDTSGLQRLAAGPSQDVAQLIGMQIADTLRKINTVRDQNTPAGDVNVFKLGKIVALTKARQSIAEGSWQAKVIDEEAGHATKTSVFTDIALGLLNLAMVALAPATGGASLIVAAGLSTATAVMHAQAYMLEDAMAGSDIDKARALSQEEPSLFWLAVDIVGAVGDIGAGASAAAKLTGVWKAAAPAVRAVKAAETADEVAAARAELTHALKDEPEVLTRVTKSVDEEGRLTNVSKEIEEVEKAAQVTEAELNAGRQLNTKGGHVHVTQRGRVYSCSSPCTEMRARYSEVLASDKGEMLKELNAIEEEAAKLKPGDEKGLKDVAERAAALDDKLFEIALRARAQTIAAWLPTIEEAYPALKEHPLGVDAIMRIIDKTTVDHIKGQLLEELVGSKIEKMITAGDKAGLEAFAGERAGAALEYIPGHRIKDSEKKLFTDGMLIIRDPEKPLEIEIVSIFESKSGQPTSKGLGAKYEPLKVDGSYKSLKEISAGRPFEKLKEGERNLFEARRDAIVELIEDNPKKYGKLKIEQIDQAANAQADIARVMDQTIKTEAGQAVKDIERAIELGFTIEGIEGGAVLQAAEAGRSGRGSTKVVGVLPTNVNAAAIEAKVGGKQGINFGTTDVGMTSKDLIDLASEIAARATPTL